MEQEKEGRQHDPTEHRPALVPRLRLRRAGEHHVSALK